MDCFAFKMSGVPLTLFLEALLVFCLHLLYPCIVLDKCPHLSIAPLKEMRHAWMSMLSCGCS